MIENCGQCQYVIAHNAAMGGVFFGCSKTKLVVPQHTNRNWERGEITARFHRVPLECPLPGDKAHKRPADPDEDTMAVTATPAP